MKRQAPFMSADGKMLVRRVGLPRPFLGDAYHWLRTTTWPRTFLAITCGWLVSNTFFAVLYLLGGDCIANAEPGSYADAFFFSVQTLSTIGYGGLAPATDYANIVASLEAFYGLLFTAVTTGILFAKFATPTARLHFARDALITRLQGKRMLSFRIANARESHIVEASIRVSLARNEQDEYGSLIRRIYDLALVRDSSPLIALTWTVMHCVDEDSPLWGLDAEDLTDMNATLLVNVSGTEDQLATRVHARHAYTDEHIVFDRRYVDVLRVDEDGARYVDYRVFHDHEAL